jgi:hypothetical protein
MDSVTVDIILFPFIIGMVVALTQFLVYEAGPFGIFSRLRYFVGINQLYDIVKQEFVPTHTAYVAPYVLRANNLMFVSNGKFFAELLSCHICTSVWVSFFVVAPFYFLPIFVGVIPLWLAVSGFSMFLLQIMHK